MIQIVLIARMDLEPCDKASYCFDVFAGVSRCFFHNNIMLNCGTDSLTMSLENIYDLRSLINCNITREVLGRLYNLISNIRV